MTFQNAPTLTLDAERTHLDPKTIVPGARLGRFVVERLVGRGAMGAVYEARDPELDRQVALKVLTTDGTLGVGRARMLREAQAVARLDHPNVVSIYEVGALDDEVLFFAMQLVEGENLGEWLAGDPEPTAIIERFEQAGRGLAAAHRAGLVHRDFKPANVLVDRTGQVFVADFGLARRFEEVADASTLDGASTLDPDASLTRTGALVGTPKYMSPEQLDRGPVDARADQFAYCVALWEALAGRHPFSTGDLSTLRGAIASGPSGTPRGSSRRLVAALRRGLSERADDRFASMDALLQAMRPARWPRFMAVASLSVAAVAGAAFFGSRAGATEPLVITAPPCIDGVEVVDEGFPSDAEASVREAFARGGFEAGRRQAEYFMRGVEQRRSAWVEQWNAACRATHVEGTQSASALDLRQACLRDARDELTALIEVVSDASLEHESLQLAAEQLADLPTLEWCAEVDALRDSTQLPRDPSLRAEVLELRKEFHRLFMLTTAKHDTETDIYDEVVTRARKLGHGPTLAKALHEKGINEMRRVDPEPSIALFDEAVRIASKSGDAMLEGEAWTHMARSLSAREKDKGVAQARVALAAARASAQRAAEPRWVLGKVDLMDGKMAVYLDRDLEGALSLLERSKDHFSQANGDFRLEIADVERETAMVLARLERFDEAQAAAEHALALARETVGPEHALVASAHYRLMAVAAYGGDHERSRDHAIKAYEIRRATGGPNDYFTLLMANAVTQALTHLEEYEEALEWATKAVDGYANSSREGSRRMIIDPLISRAKLHLAMGNPQLAVADLERGLAAARPGLADDHVLVEEATKLLAEAKAAS